VGDDVYGDDPTVNRLEATVAETLGKEAAVFVPSGTMANQIALQVHTRRGDEVMVGESAHVAVDESGAGAAWAGVLFRVVGSGAYTRADLAAALHGPEIHSARQRLVWLENPHSRAGGRVLDPREVAAIVELGRARGLALHLDGARIWNVEAATGVAASELARGFDTVSVCFSKGLGAPVGSAIVGSAAAMLEARRARKMFGGGMRQAGVLAAAALYALEHHRTRLADDHAHARAIDAAMRVAADGDTRVHMLPTETNQVNVEIDGVPAERLCAAARTRGVLVGAMSHRRTRAVTHLDVAREVVPDVARALADALREILA